MEISTQSPIRIEVLKTSDRHSAIKNETTKIKEDIRKVGPSDRLLNKYLSRSLPAAAKVWTERHGSDRPGSEIKQARCWDLPRQVRSIGADCAKKALRQPHIYEHGKAIRQLA